MQLPVEKELLRKVWTDAHGVEFLVDDVYNQGGHMWVEYHRANDKTYYNCLLEAFTHRFSPREPKQ